MLVTLFNIRKKLLNISQKQEGSVDKLKGLPEPNIFLEKNLHDCRWGFLQRCYHFINCFTADTKNDSLRSVTLKLLLILGVIKILKIDR